MRRRYLFTAAALAGLAGCGSASDKAELACTRTDQDPLSPLQEMEAELACEMPAGPGLTIRFVQDPESDPASCGAALIATGPKGFESPRIEIGMMTREGRYTGSSLAVREFLFSDRLSNSAELALAPDRPCSNVSVAVQDIKCRASVEASADYTSCGEVQFEGSDMFEAFEGPQT